MQKSLSKFMIIFIFVLMLSFPKLVFSGACEGLLLWFNSVLPTLLPFMILSNLLIKTHAADLLVRVTGPLFRHIFGISDYGTFAAVTGFLCGYPMGSKAASDLLMEGRISKQEAQYLLSFCNNASPIFIISYIVLQNLKQEALMVPALVILMASPVLASFLFRPFYRHYGSGAIRPSSPALRDSAYESGNIIDGCIMNGFEMITKVGGYIMLFSILITFAKAAFSPEGPVGCLLLSSMELTGGISLLCRSAFSSSETFFLCMVCTSFGGWCALAQTNCMISESGLSIKPYLIQKLVTALVTSLLCMIYLHFS